MKWLLWAGLALGGLGLWYAWASRIDDPARWHVDPFTATPPRSPNWVRLLPPSAGGDAPVFDVTAAELARAFDAMATAQPGTYRLAGAPDALWATYVQRSRLMRYPDYISVKFVEEGPGRSSLAIYSRSRFGWSDGGVNRARVNRWLARLAERLGEAAGQS